MLGWQHKVTNQPCIVKNSSQTSYIYEELLFVLYSHMILRLLYSYRNCIAKARRLLTNNDHRKELSYYEK